MLTKYTKLDMELNTHYELNFATDVNKTDIQFNEIFNLEEIQRMQDLFSDATGVASIITYPDGTPITVPSNFCRLCNDIIRKTEKGCANCFRSDAFIGQQNLTGPNLQPCLSGGLWDAGASITIENKHVANWLIGQIRTEEMDEQHMLEYADEIGADKGEFLRALKEVPMMSVERFKKVADMLFTYANDISDKMYKNIQLKIQIEEHKKTNDLLHKSEESLSVTLNSIGDGVISTDKSGAIVKMNPIAENLCGCKFSEANGKQLDEVFNIINSETRQPLENPVKKVLEEGKIIGLANHTVLISKNGSEYHIADSAAPILNGDGEISGVVLVFSDVTLKYEADEKLKESERSKSVLLSNLPGFAYRCKFDRQWTKEFVSEGFLDITGYKTEDIINNRSISFNDLILPEYSDHLWDVWEEAVQNHQKVNVEYRITTADNQVKWVWEQGIPIYNTADGVEALEGLILDITPRKQAEEKFQNERLLLRTLIDNIPDLIFAKDLNFRKTLANPAEVNNLGAKLEAEVLGKTDFDHYPVEFAQEFYAEDQLVLQSGKPLLQKEESRTDQNGKKKWIVLSKLPMFDEDNRIVGLVGVGHDITNRKIMEEALRDSERFLKETQMIAQLGTYTFDIVHNKWESSEVLNNIFGIEPEFSKTLESWAVIIHPEFQELMSDYFMQEVVGKKTWFDKVYKILRQSDKSERWVHGLGQLVFNEKNEPVKMIGIILDITEQKQAEELLRRSEEKYRNIFENVQDVFYQVDMSGNITQISPSVKYFADFNPEELIGKPAVSMYKNAASRDFMFQELIKKGELRDYEIDLISKSGIILNVSINARLIYDSKGNPSHIDGALRDITNRKIMEVALHDSEKFLNETQVIAQLGNCTVDLITKTWKSSEIMDSIFGIEKDFVKTLKGIASIIHPDWTKKMHDYFINDVFGKTDKFNIKFKIIRPLDHEERWIHAIGERKTNEEKKSSKLIITVQDITERKKAAELLRESEALHRSILASSPDAIIVVEIDGAIRMVSPAALSLYGCESDKLLIGKNMFDFFVPEDLERAKSNCILMFSRDIGAIEYRIFKSNGIPFFAEVSGDIIWSSDGQPMGMVLIVRDISDRKLAEVSLKNSQVQLKKFAAHLQSVREEERILLAREIHDELGQILIAIKIDLGMLKQITLKSIKTSDAEIILTNFDNLFSLVDNTIKTTRKIMTDLRPEVLYLLGFVEAVKLQTHKFQERHGINCYFDNTVSELELNTQQSVALFRIMQESLTNVAKHAKATSVKITLRKEDDKLVFEVKDNGVGFNEINKNKRDSYGLIGMKERVFLLAGELVITTQPENGTSIKVVMPYSEVQIHSNASSGLSD
jgi:PAS domain S-box-containing protein